MHRVWIAGTGPDGAGPHVRGPGAKRKETPLAQDSLYRLTTKTLEGQPADLRAYAGKVALVVNVASQCGYTPQYAGLEKLYGGAQGQGLRRAGVPEQRLRRSGAGDGRRRSGSSAP